MTPFQERAKSLICATKQRLLSNYSADNLFALKKAEMLLKINLLFFILIFFVVAPIHYSEFTTKPFLFIGDLLLALGMIASLIMLSHNKAQSATTLTAIVLMSTPFVHNVVGDFVNPSQATPTRFFETLIFICFLFPLIISFSYKKHHIFISTFLSISILFSHFMILNYFGNAKIPNTMLVYLVILIILGFIGLMNLNLTNKAIETLIESRNQIADWNKSLELTVEQRTKELKESNLKLEAISQTDGLTGIANRRSFDTHYISEWNRAKRSNSRISIFMLDLDQFKLYNDTFGHQQGDLCLKLVAEKLTELSQRSGEMAARYGGEEFIIIVPGIDATEALQYGEMIRSSIEALAIRHSEVAIHPYVTVSIGISVCHITAKNTPEACLKVADQALYHAKETGRNTIQLTTC